jgi:hypothetical protein
VHTVNRHFILINMCIQSTGTAYYSTQLNVRKVGIKYKYENYRIEASWYHAGVIPCDILVPHIEPHR